MNWHTLFYLHQGLITCGLRAMALTTFLCGPSHNLGISQCENKKYLWNVGELPPDYTAQHSRTHSSSHSPLWEPELSPTTVSFQILACSISVIIFIFRFTILCLLHLSLERQSKNESINQVWHSSCCAWWNSGLERRVDVSEKLLPSGLYEHSQTG
jgi:hypothetical protein